ncbi:hypothetical protein [Caulobacter mirabilis]|uniref:Uncharacterized protein n=1 Tax=Caulobacter mirabilis TaxID=69666 RepID=A0A2D2B1H5_9CAUL|nr:hypothetical protein [Caulobacter mirabilis]ATQ44076.1 hypothetical protein CSW64_17615 [Caulobacter mirabilis]
MQASIPPPSIESAGGKLTVLEWTSSLPLYLESVLWFAPLAGAALALCWSFARYYQTAERAYQKQKAAGRLSDGLRNPAASR